jgi:hypothetical protein
VLAWGSFGGRKMWRMRKYKTLSAGMGLSSLFSVLAMLRDWEAGFKRSLSYSGELAVVFATAKHYLKYPSKVSSKLA